MSTSKPTIPKELLEHKLFKDYYDLMATYNDVDLITQDYDGELNELIECFSIIKPHLTELDKYYVYNACLIYKGTRNVLDMLVMAKIMKQYQLNNLDLTFAIIESVETNRPRVLIEKLKYSLLHLIFYNIKSIKIDKVIYNYNLKIDMQSSSIIAIDCKVTKPRYDITTQYIAPGLPIKPIIVGSINTQRNSNVLVDRVLHAECIVSMNVADRFYYLVPFNQSSPNSITLANRVISISRFKAKYLSGYAIVPINNDGSRAYLDIITKMRLGVHFSDLMYDPSTAPINFRTYGV